MKWFIDIIEVFLIAFVAALGWNISGLVFSLIVSGF